MRKGRMGSRGVIAKGREGGMGMEWKGKEEGGIGKREGKGKRKRVPANKIATTPLTIRSIKRHSSKRLNANGRSFFHLLKILGGPGPRAQWARRH